MSVAKHEIAYKESLERHIAAVQEYGKRIGVPHMQLERHDESKWLPVEFDAYARHFYGPKDDPTGMAHAWLHHIHNNPHHWNHWMFTGGWTPKGADCENGVLEMPRLYALEMIADWHGAGYAYTSDWDISEWLISSMGRITLHSKTALFVRNKLDVLGYGEIVWAHTWAHEAEVPARELT